jgi:hypothetical protein
MPALAALSAMVSKIFRVALVSGSIRSTRVSRISNAGTTKSVAFSTSNRVQPGPARRCFIMNASSASTRAAMKRSDGTGPPSAKNMSSSSTPESGSSILSALCIAFEVRPILWPFTTRPSASLISIRAF